MHTAHELETRIFTHPYVFDLFVFVPRRSEFFFLEYRTNTNSPQIGDAYFDSFVCFELFGFCAEAFEAFFERIQSMNAKARNESRSSAEVEILKSQRAVKFTTERDCSADV